MTPRRSALRAIDAIEKVPPSELAWVWVYLLTKQRPPADELVFERDQAIRRYRERWHAGTSQRAAVAAIARAAAVYRAGQWRRHQHLASAPAELRGTARADLFEIFKLGDVPDVEMLRKILGRTG
jgi:hypothetical protein